MNRHQNRLVHDACPTLFAYNNYDESETLNARSMRESIDAETVTVTDNETDSISNNYGTRYNIIKNPAHAY